MMCIADTEAREISSRYLYDKSFRKLSRKDCADVCSLARPVKEPRAVAQDARLLARSFSYTQFSQVRRVARQSQATQSGPKDHEELVLAGMRTQQPPNGGAS
jgi:hypothetical protein